MNPNDACNICSHAINPMLVVASDINEHFAKQYTLMPASFVVSSLLNHVLQESSGIGYIVMRSTDLVFPYFDLDAVENPSISKLAIACNLYEELHNIIKCSRFYIWSCPSSKIDGAISCHVYAKTNDLVSMNALKEIALNVKCCDRSVYASLQCFRLPLCWKFGQFERDFRLTDVIDCLDSGDFIWKRRDALTLDDFYDAIIVATTVKYVSSEITTRKIQKELLMNAEIGISDRMHQVLRVLISNFNVSWSAKCVKLCPDGTEIMRLRCMCPFIDGFHASECQSVLLFPTNVSLLTCNASKCRGKKKMLTYLCVKCKKRIEINCIEPHKC